MFTRKISQTANSIRNSEVIREGMKKERIISEAKRKISIISEAAIKLSNMSTRIQEKLQKIGLNNREEN
jgi:hypothetical protein